MRVYKQMTQGPTKAYLGDGLYAEIESDMLKLTAEDGIAVHDAVFLERSVWVALTNYMMKHAGALLAAVLCLAAPAYADDFYEVLTVHEPELLQYRLPDLVFLVRDDGSFVFGPSPNTDAPVNLGIPTRPFRNGFFQNRVSAASFVANGSTGISTVIHFGQCVLTIQGGLITSAVVPPGNQPCP